jgi:hypothetical protein
MALTISYDLIYAPSEFRTNTQANGNQISPDVIGLTNGGFVSAYNNIAFNGITLDFYDAAAAGVAALPTGV